MAKRFIEEFKNNEDYKRIVKRIFISVLIIVPYIVIFFFLEHYGIVKKNASTADQAIIQQLQEENALLKEQILQLTGEEVSLSEKTPIETK